MNPPGRRGGTPEQARAYQKAGHDAALVFALLMGLSEDYRRDRTAKKDVIDPAGDAHSVKAGAARWQVFLYGRNRFLEDDGFQALNGIGSLLVHCIDAFPPRWEDYQDNKEAAKIRLQTPMRELKDRFQRKALLRGFLKKSFFNGGEVNYLTVLHDGIYHVYWNDDVVRAIAERTVVENSKARNRNQYDDQKVILKHAGYNVGELEMRNSSRGHYAQVLFNVNKLRFMDILQMAITESEEWEGCDVIELHGQAMRTFGQWTR